MPKNKILDLKLDSSSDSDDSEHELNYYAKDRVKLMKEVLKIIKPKKIKSMAPSCIKHLDIVEINSMLLEELLGISSKRLQYVFKGENVDRESSSSDPDEEKADVISLDDISEDDDLIELGIEENKSNATKELNKNVKSNKGGINKKKIKTEKQHKTIHNKNSKVKESASRSLNIDEKNKDRLMSVLELLELQARARAIRSQLAIENEKKTEQVKIDSNDKNNDSDSDAVIIDTPQFKEIVITSSDSENETTENFQDKQSHQLFDKENLNEATENSVEILNTTETSENLAIANNSFNLDNCMKKDFEISKRKKVKLIRDKNNENILGDNSQECDDIQGENLIISENNKIMDQDEIIKDITIKQEPDRDRISKKVYLESDCDNDEIVINLDEDEMVGIEDG